MDIEKIKAILFDLDGVLVDSEPLHFEAHQKALEHFGIKLALEDYMDFGVAKGDDNLYQKTAEKYGVEIDKQEISKLKRQIYRDIFAEKGRLIDGIEESLKKFHAEYELALVSSGSKESIDFVLEKIGLKKYFKVVVTGDDVERVKPFPDIYLKAIKALAFEKEFCVAIEDSVTGIEAAKSAGIKCIAIPNEFTKNQDLSRADAMVEKLEDLNEGLIVAIKQ